MNIFVIFIAFYINLSSIDASCAPQVYDHDLLSDGDELSADIQNFTIKTEATDECDVILRLEFNIDWNWWNGSDNFEDEVQEINVLETALRNYIMDLYKAFNQSFVDMELNHVDVTHEESTEILTKIKSTFKCSALEVERESFLEADCDGFLRKMLEKFQIKSLTMHFYDIGISVVEEFGSISFNSEEKYANEPDAIEDSEKEEEANENSKEKFKFRYQITTQDPQESLLHKNYLYENFEEIYEDVKDDKETQSAQSNTGLFVERVTTSKFPIFNYLIQADLLVPYEQQWKNAESDEHQMFSETFETYVQKLHAANPKFKNSKILCKVDQISENFVVDSDGEAFGADTTLVNFYIHITGIEVREKEDLELSDGNVFDKIFANFQIDEFLKLYKMRRSDEYSVDRHGFVHFDEIGEDFDDYDDESDENGRKDENIVRNRAEYEIFDGIYDDDRLESEDSDEELDLGDILEDSTKSAPFIADKTSTSAVTSNINLNNQDSLKSEEITDESNENERKVMLTINADNLRMVYEGKEYLTCANCKVKIYSNFEVEYENNDKELELVEIYEAEDEFEGYGEVKNSSSVEEQTHQDQNNSSENLDTPNNELSKTEYPFSSELETSTSKNEEINEISKESSQKEAKNYKDNQPMWTNLINKNEVNEKYLQDLTSIHLSPLCSDCDEINTVVGSKKPVRSKKFDFVKDFVGESYSSKFTDIPAQNHVKNSMKSSQHSDLSIDSSYNLPTHHISELNEPKIEENFKVMFNKSVSTENNGTNRSCSFFAVILCALVVLSV